MKLAEKFDIPIITLLDTPGAYPGLEAEQRGQAEAIARNLKMMALLKVPLISVVIGEGASGSHWHWHGQRGLYDGKYLVFGDCAGIVFNNPLENKGLQRTGCFRAEADSRRSQRTGYY